MVSIAGIQFFLYNTMIQPYQGHIFRNHLGIVMVGLIAFTSFYLLFRFLVNYFNVSTKNLSRWLTIFIIIVSVGVIAMFFAPLNPLDPAKTANAYALGNGYIQSYPNNIGLAVIYKLIFEIFGRQAWFLLEFLNATALIITFRVLPKLTFQISGSEKAQRETILLSFFLWQFMFLVIWQYNDLLMLPFIISGIYYLLKYTVGESQKIRYLFISGLLIFLAYFVRPNATIFIIALSIYLIFKAIQVRKVKFLLAFLPIIMAVGGISAFKASYSTIIPQYRAENSQPTSAWISFALANNNKKQLPGENNSFPWLLKVNYEKNHPKEKFTNQKWDQLCKAYIAQRTKHLLTHPSEAFVFFAKREVANWGDPTLEAQYTTKLAYDAQTNANETYSYNDVADFDGILYNNKEYYQDHRQELQSPFARSVANGKIASGILNGVDRPIIFMILLATLVFILVNRKKLTLEQFLFILIFTGGFLFHEFVWESQSRYSLPYLLVLVPLAAIFISEISLTHKKK